MGTAVLGENFSTGDGEIRDRARQGVQQGGVILAEPTSQSNA
jgi:hypothetical protein